MFILWREKKIVTLCPLIQRVVDTQAAAVAVAVVDVAVVLAVVVAAAVAVVLAVVVDAAVAVVVAAVGAADVDEEYIFVGIHFFNCSSPRPRLHLCSRR